jgi:hypothetical protein
MQVPMVETMGEPRKLFVNPAATSLAANEFLTLADACAAARNDDFIELQYDGRRVERPIRLNNLKLTIRAQGAYRPVVAFQPKEATGQSQAMFTVVGGNVTFVGVAFELDLPRHIVAESWSLFETQRPKQLEFKQCSMTIRNATADRRAYQSNVAFIDLKAPPGAGAMTMETMPVAEPVRLTLANCIARGEAVFLRATETQPATLTWTNGLLATSERLLLETGGDASSRSPEGRIVIYLDHVTAFTRNGLCLIGNSDDARYLMGADFECRTRSC